MLPKVCNSLSTIPQGKERPVYPEKHIDLLGLVDLLMKHLTPALCQNVFRQFRNTERERKWTFQAVAQFWTAMMIYHPPAIRSGLDQTRKGRGKDKLWPRVLASPQSFFQKCARLSPDFFKALYDAFTNRTLPQAPILYVSWMKLLQKKFPEILIVDGSKLDAICRRLKFLRGEGAAILPGCLTVFYDLFRGITRQVWFYPNAAEPELPRAQKALSFITPGSLIIGDRLYACLQYFHALAARKLHGLFRVHGKLKIKRLGLLSRRQGGRMLWEEFLVEVGCGRHQSKMRLRLIRFRGQGYRLDLLTDILEPQKLSAQEAVQLYGLRWSIERVFFDLKEVLNLHCLYASHPCLVAQQIYAAAIVHTAFRIAQASIAAKAKVLPEQISPAKLFPKLARAASDYCVLHWSRIETRDLNPNVEITFPDFRRYPSSYTNLRSILVQRRNSKRRKRKFSVSERKRWKSFVHVHGGRSFLKSITVH